MARANFSHKLKFFFVEPIALGPLLLLLLIQNEYTLVFAAVSTLFLFFLSLKGLTLQTLARKFRVILIGKVRYIRPFWRKEL
jgi:hypothetical protein